MGQSAVSFENDIEIVIQHIGKNPGMTSCSGGSVTVSDANHARVLIQRVADRGTTVIFTGSEFSETEYEKRLVGKK